MEWMKLVRQWWKARRWSPFDDPEARRRLDRLQQTEQDLRRLGIWRDAFRDPSSERAHDRPAL
jgi:hypothetical protein